MDRTKWTVSGKRIIESVVLLLFCMLVILGTATQLIMYYKPDQNSLGALGTVCMDVISMAVLLILVISFVFEKDESTRTTRLFLALMTGTILGLFLDFLTWSSDGALAFSNWTYAVTVASLCGGPILAAIFVLYLGSYLDDMYELRSVLLVSKICFICNVIALIITIGFAFTHNAFTFVDGHYETAPLYDVITVIPVLTLIYMTGYAVSHIRAIGSHDVIAVAGYIITMIVGAGIEAVYVIGATYVSIAIADIFIFLMLQNRIINRVRKQREILSEEITSQFEILKSMAGIYSHVNLVDLEGMYSKRFDIKDSRREAFKLSTDPHTGLNKGLYPDIVDERKLQFWEFTDLSTLSERMAGEKIISAEFRHKRDGWLRAQYIRIGKLTDEPIKRVIYAIQNIDEEKKNVEKWIIKSNTDELTGFFNRHAYEEEIAAVLDNPKIDNFVYVSMDVNGLKVVNDNLGHEAGDELLRGACECMEKCFAPHGKLFRTGGDEFAAFIFADNERLDKIRKDFDEITGNWTGRLLGGLAISAGYVMRREVPDITIHEMAVIADKRMYEAKARFYRELGIDRRGPKDVGKLLYYVKKKDE